MLHKRSQVSTTTPLRATVSATRRRVPGRQTAVTVVCASVLLTTLDTAIVNLAMPILADEFDTSVPDILWVSLTFLVVAAGLALPMGRLGDLYGHGRIFVGGWTVYTTGLVIAAAAPSLPVLLVARVVQACGAAMIGANGTAIITSATPARHRGKALGILAASVGAGQAAGPIVGGFLMEVLGWRAIFWTRIPPALALIVVSRHVLRGGARTSTNDNVDVAGSVMLVAAIGTFVIGVNRTAAWGPTAVPALTLLGASAAAIVLFVRVARTSSSPVVDLTLFRSRGFSLAILTAVLHHVGRAGAVVLIPFFLLEGRGLTLVETSTVMVTIPATLIAVAPLSGALADRFGPRVLTTVAQAILSAALLLLATVSATTSITSIVARLLLVGVGAGLFGSPNTAAIMSSVPTDHLGTASAAASTARQIGQSVGIALAGAMFAVGAAAFTGGDVSPGQPASTLTPDAVVAGFRFATVVGAVIVAGALLVSWARGQRPSPPDQRAATLELR